MDRHNYFVYMHKRLDKNEIFYIGKGKIDHRSFSEKSRYARAFSKRGRNKQWISITNRTEYSVEIYKTFETEKEAYNEEARLVSTYGRKLFEGGSLINIDEGGITNREFDKNPHRVKFDNRQKIYFYSSISGLFIKECPSLREACEQFNIGKTSIHRSLKNNGLVNNFLISKTYLGEKIKPIIRETETGKTRFSLKEYKVSLYNPQGFIVDTFNTIKEAKSKTGIKPETITRSFKKNKVIKQGLYTGYFWKLGAAPTSPVPIYTDSEKILTLLKKGISPREISKMLNLPLQKCYKVKYKYKTLL